MPTLTRTICLAVTLAGLPAAAGDGEARDPKLNFFFEADGKRVPIELDAPFTTAALGASKSVVLRLEPHREFTYGGVRFRFPREYSFEADLADPNVKIWTLSGNDCVLMIHRYANQPSVDELQQSVVDEMLKAYKGAKKKTAPVSMDVQGTVNKGTRIEAELASTRIHQDLYAIRSGKDVVMLIVQDTPKEGGDASKERLATERLLRDSLKLGK